MGWVESLQRAIDFMEEHLLEDVLIEEIAREGNASVFHFQRTFAILTDMSVADYLRQRRLTLAAKEILTTAHKVIEIAYKYGYDTPEAFTKAFRRQHGTTPSGLRKNRGTIQSFNRLVIHVSLKGAEPMKYRIIEKEAFEAVGIKKEVSCIDGANSREIPKMWGEVNASGMTDSLARLNNGGVEGLLGICVDKRDTGGQLIDYWIAVDHKGETPEDLEKLEIPASKWGVFEVHGAMPLAIQEVWNQIISEWFPSNQYEHAGTPDLEVHPEGDPSSKDYYAEIWIPLKS